MYHLMQDIHLNAADDVYIMSFIMTYTYVLPNIMNFRTQTFSLRIVA